MAKSYDLGGVTFTDYSQEVLDEFGEACLRALEEIGITAERYAKENITRNGNVDTGLLRNSITYAISGKAPAISSYKADNPKSGKKNSGAYSGEAPKESNGLSVYIGTNVEYGPYVEMATGKHASGGRPKPWGYVDNEGAAHWTAGNPAKPFLAPAVKDHTQTFRNIIEDEMKNG